ncbi:MAG: 30S ribosomal protein S12 methylthiotransferase RimO [Treponema sp.]|jgi:ribosomal protein S12 methylthiotransferase|nr:30S ribosomal protein S12 methylthiotransferase RimO [Treponema sp.]
MRYYLDPFGCVKNQVDAETMMAYLNRSGWVSVSDAAEADIIIINSCGFIESAKQESINAVLAYRNCYPDTKIVLAGCLAQRYAQDISLPEADLLFGNRDLSHITEAVSRALKGERTVLIPETPVYPPPLTGRPLLSLPGSAYIKISEGCNNCCTFCSIPLIRGDLVSRTVPDVLQECRELLDRGIRELCLIGQDLGSYGTDRAGGQLPELLEALSQLEGTFWVRLLYIHPDRFPLSILELIRQDSRFLPYFDLPFQHGSAAILRAMNRQGTAESYLALLAKIRAILPDATIRSTFLTGFPGETDADFQALLDFQEAAQLDWVGCFTYSREEDTPAYSLKPRVSKAVAAERKARIEEQQTPITEKRMDRFIGRTLEVLVEERFLGDAEAEGLYLGRLACQAPEVDGAAVITSDQELHMGSCIRCRVFARAGFDLEVHPARN